MIFFFQHGRLYQHHECWSFIKSLRRYGSVLGLVLEPHPRGNWKDCLGNRLGWKYTMRPERRCSSNWLRDCILMCVSWITNHITLRRWKVEGTASEKSRQLSYYWAHKRLKSSKGGYKLIITNSMHFVW